MHVFLDSPANFDNLCAITRTLEVMGVTTCYVRDPYRLVRERYGKSRTNRIRVVSAGAFFRVKLERVKDPRTFLASLPGRKVAMVPNQEAEPLTRFAFATDDTILFGSEGGGLGIDLLPICDATVTIPQRGVTDSLNLSISVGIVLYEFFRQGERMVD